MLRELAQCPESELDAFQDVRRYRYFNTNTIWVNLRTLDEVLAARKGILGLPMIANEKPVDPDDPSSPRVVQLETAMGAAISVFEGARAVRVPRSRMVPVKTTNDLLALWSDVYELAEDYRIVAAKGGAAERLVVDLDPKYFRQVSDLERRFPKGAPSLREARRFTVRGNVRFGGGIVVRGKVLLQPEGADSLLVTDGTTLEG